MLYNIIQAYIQSKTDLNYMVIASLLIEIKKKYPKGIILFVIKPLYSLTEAGIYQFTTYIDHYKKRLAIETSCFNPCLLLTINSVDFRIIGLQTNNTINIGILEFIWKEEEELKKAEFKAKASITLNNRDAGDFNGYYIEVAEGTLTI